MTQILAALTQEYVLVASDRQLTFASGPRQGQIAEDNSCKLVSLCGNWGIAYTGFAQLQGGPTHEWIAVRLAEMRCKNPYLAAQILSEAAGQALRESPSLMELTFLISGWRRLDDSQMLQPHFLLVSNQYGPDRERRPTPGSKFLWFERKLKANEVYAGHVIGQSLPNGRGRYLDRFLRRLLKHGVGPKPAMQAFVREIVNTSQLQSTVGDRILAFSIPKAAAKRTYEKGTNMILAKEPDLCDTAFCYFDPTYSSLLQYGPTYTCGDSAVTDLVTENDSTRDYQSSSLKVLYRPKPTT